jgi:hypothetical protein
MAGERNSRIDRPVVERPPDYDLGSAKEETPRTGKRQDHHTITGTTADTRITLTP